MELRPKSQGVVSQSNQGPVSQNTNSGGSTTNSRPLRRFTLSLTSPTHSQCVKADRKERYHSKNELVARALRDAYEREGESEDVAKGRSNERVRTRRALQDTFAALPFDFTAPQSSWVGCHRPCDGSCWTGAECGSACWTRDLTADGDVEANPGPAWGRLVTVSNTQVNLTVLTASGAETVDPGLLTAVLYGGLTRMATYGVQIVRNGDSALALPVPASSFTAVAVTGVGEWLTIGHLGPYGSTATVSENIAIPVAGATLAGGDAIVLSARTVALDSQFAGLYVAGSYPVGGGSSAPTGVSDVNVVGMSRLSEPLWTCTIDPGSAPIVPPPAVATRPLPASVRGWLRDLLSDGDVESNPGPAARMEIEDLFVNRQTGQNPYAGLEVTEIEQRVERAVDHEMPRATAEYARCVLDDRHIYRADPRNEVFSLAEDTARKVIAKSHTAEGGAGKAPRAQIEAKPARERHDLARQRSAAVKRIVARFTDWGSVVDWLHGGSDQPDSEFAASVVDQALRRQPALADGEGLDCVVATKVAQGRKRAHIMQSVFSRCPTTMSVMASPEWAVWWKREFPGYEDPVRDLTIDGDVESNPGPSGWVRDLTNDGDVESNPGPGDWAFPNSMDELENGQTLLKLMTERGSPSGPLQNPIAEVEQLTGLSGQQGVTMSSVPREMALRGGTISTANAVTLLNELNSPEALLKPLRVRNGAGAGLVDSTRRPQLFGVGQVRRDALYPAVESAEGAALREIVSRMGNIRPDQITRNGFYTSDVAALTRLQPENNGDTLFVPFLKMWLYTLSRAWLAGTPFLPLGGEPGKFDSFTQLDVNPTVAVGYNDAGVFAADCGGATAVFPYLDAAVVPTVAFHVCQATVPVGQPWVYMPPGLLLQNDLGENAANIALFTLMLADYPCGVHTVTIDTLDSAGGNAAAQAFVPHSDLVHVGGERTLNIVLPCKTASAPPTTAAAAASQALITPTTGPTASTGLGADAALAINARGVALVTYDLAEFLYTWMALPASPIDITSLTRFVKQAAELTRRSQDLRFTFELAASLTARYPAMFTRAPGGGTAVPAVNSAGSDACQSFFGEMPHAMTADYPQSSSLYDRYAPQTNWMWWNKIVSGAYISTPDDGMYPPLNESWEGSDRLLQYAVHMVRDYACTSEHVFTFFGMPREVWNNSFTQQNHIGVLSQIRAIFISANDAGAGSIMTSRAGPTLNVLHSRVNGCQPAKNMYGHTIWEMINSPRVGFQGVWTAGTGVLETPTPSVLADIWVQLGTCERTLAMTPMLSSNKLLTGVPLKDGAVVPLGAGAYTTPIPVGMQGREVLLNSRPRVNDAHLFNQRLVWHTFPAALYTLDSNVYAVSSVPSTEVVAQKPVIADWTVPNLISDSILTAKTTWIPLMTSDGLRLAVGVSAANGAALMTQILSKRQTTGVACWLVRNAHAMPNVIVDGGGGEDDDWWYGADSNSDSGNAEAPEPMAAATGAETPPSHEQ